MSHKRKNPPKPPAPPTKTQSTRSGCSRWLSGTCHGGSDCICIPSGGGK